MANRHPQYLLPLAVAFIAGLTVASGVVSGMLTDRWGASLEMQRASDAVEGFPTEIGSWAFQGQQPLGEEALEQLQCAGYVNGVYMNRDSGESVVVSLIVGPFGPMSVHSPEVCYPAAGYRSLAAPRRLSIGAEKDGAGPDEFWISEFEAKGLGALPLHVYFAWSSGGHWKAPDWPRFALGGSPVLYKIQVAASYDADEFTDKTSPCYQFLTEFLPVFADKTATAELSR